MLSNSCHTYLLSKALSPRQSKSAEGFCYFILLSHFSMTANTTFLTSGFAVRSHVLLSLLRFILRLSSVADRIGIRS